MSTDGYLPPGCRHIDVDIAAGAVVRCSECGAYNDVERERCIACGEFLED